MTLETYFTTWGWVMLLALLCGMINWISVARRVKKIEYIFKPLTMVVLLLAAWLMKNASHSTYLRAWFLPALFFSLCGDIFLMFNGNSVFLLGLVSFLLAHLCYIAGLNRSLPPVGAWVIVIAAGLVYAIVYPKISRALKQKGELKLRIPTAIYAIILSIMLSSVWTVILRSGWSSTAKLVVVMGGSLFYVSDLLLAWNRFVKHTNRRDVYVIVTYQIAQLLLTSSIAFSP